MTVRVDNLYRFGTESNAREMVNVTLLASEIMTQPYREDAQPDIAGFVRRHNYTPILHA